ncbi:PAS domain-containing protein [Aquicoccus sp. SCR17]|nr:PAS domain-containing protein [Carideicomes alvinocaridis]
MGDSDSIDAEQILAAVSQPILVLTDDLEVEVANRAFCEAFDVSPEETQNRMVYELGKGQWDIPELRKLLQEVLSERHEVDDYRVEHEFERIGERVMLLNARRMPQKTNGDRIVLAINDVTKHERLRYELEGRKEFSGKLVDSVREGLLIFDFASHRLAAEL